MVTVSHNDNDHATADFKLKDVALPVANDLSVNAKLAMIDGKRDTNGGPPQVLFDQKLPASADDPKANFFFQSDRGRLAIDLGAETNLKQISTYSWHVAERAPQVYTVYGTNAELLSGNVKFAGNIDPTTLGWSLIAHVDTNAQYEGQGGQYGVSITSSRGSLGKYRYLLFMISKGALTDDNGENLLQRDQLRARGCIGITGGWATVNVESSVSSQLACLPAVRWIQAIQQRVVA